MNQKWQHIASYNHITQSTYHCYTAGVYVTTITTTTSIFSQRKLIWNVVDSIYPSRTYVRQRRRWRCLLARALLLIHFVLHILNIRFNVVKMGYRLCYTLFFSVTLFYFLLISFNCSRFVLFHQLSFISLFVSLLTRLLIHWSIVRIWWTFLRHDILTSRCVIIDRQLLFVAVRKKEKNRF